MLEVQILLGALNLILQACGGSPELGQALHCSFAASSGLIPTHSGLTLTSALAFLFMFSDEYFMRQALKEALKASRSEDVPVGAVIVHKNHIIGRGYNQVELLKDPTAHAEMIAITQAASELGSKWLIGCALYVTIEPCSMCAGALVLSRIKRVVFGAYDPKTGAGGSVFDILNNRKLNHRIQATPGILTEDCASLLQDFFRKQRSKNN